MSPPMAAGETRGNFPEYGTCHLKIMKIHTTLAGDKFIVSDTPKRKVKRNRRRRKPLTFRAWLLSAVGGAIAINIIYALTH
jgi:predicted anti-sigma-YlaC factor YlaD